MSETNLPEIVDRPRAVSTPGFAVGGVADDAGDRLDVAALFALFRRRIRLFALVALLVFGAACYVVSKLPKLYMASADVVLDVRGQGGTPEVLAVLSDAPRGAEDISTELTVLYSRELAEQVLSRIDLEGEPSILPPGVVLGDGEADRLSLLDFVRSGLEASRVGNAFTLRVSYKHPDPEAAALLANTYASAYVDSAVNRERDSLDRAAGFLDGRIEELREQARRDVEAVQVYRIENDMLSAQGRTLNEQDISAISQQLVLARAAAAEDKARLDTALDQLAEGAPGTDGGAVGEALNSNVVATLKGRKGELATLLADMRGRLGPRHPDRQGAEREYADVSQQIVVEVDRVISGLAAKAEVSRRRAASLEASLAGAQGQLETNNRAMVELDDLERQAAASQGLYETYLNTYKETVARGGMETPEARVVSAARVPGVPVEPRVGLVLAFGGVLGLGLGVAAAYLAEATYSGLTTGAEVEDGLGVPYVGMMAAHGRVRSADDLLAALAKAPVREELADSLLTSLRFQARGGTKVLAVVSALPDEGKTNLTVLLALVAARRGERTIIVDCDPKRCGATKLFGVAGAAGMSDVLAGDVDLEDAIRPTGVEGADLLPIGARELPEGRWFDDPSSRFARMLAELRADYDRVILDGRPILAVAAGREVACYAEHILVAVQWRGTSRAAVRQALGLLPASVHDRLSVVLTRVDLKRQVRYASGDQLSYFSRYRKYYASGRLS